MEVAAHAVMNWCETFHGCDQQPKALPPYLLKRVIDLIRCIVDTANDPHEISLDENVTRENMHPADQFEAFKKLAEERGYGAEEIAARFGVMPHVVRQRMATTLNCGG